MLARRMQMAAAGAGATWYAGLTDLVAVYQPKGAASLAASYVNLVNPGTYDAAPGTTPTFAAATGWTFNGSTQYLTTGIAVAANRTIIVRFSTADSAGNKALIGSRGASGGGTGQVIWRYGSPGTDRYYDNGTRGTVSGVITAGVLTIAGTKAYKDGVDEGVTLSNAPAGPSLYIGAMNNNGTAAFFYNGNIQAIAICSSIQTAEQITAASAAVALI